VTGALPYDERPTDASPVHTADLPDTPQRDRNIPAAAWEEAPDAIRTLGADLGHDDVFYKRRIGGWLLWRAGPATKGDARYGAVAASDLSAVFTFRLFADGTGEGTGPSGESHSRFRSWKEDLRDNQPPG
jgi:hypothetical protein